MASAAGDGPAPRVPRHRTTLREYAEAVLVAVVFALFAKAFLVETYQIPSGSMEESLLVGDHVVVDKLGWAPRGVPWGPLLPSRGIRRGDVVVFRGPEEPGRDFIKRAVALPGETLEIRGKRLFVDGVPQEEPWVVHRDPAVLAGEDVPASVRGRDELAPRTLPAETFFALGDNRDESRDSRAWGPVPMGHVRGRALFVYWSVRPPAEPIVGRNAGLRRLLDGAIHFFSRTRWKRTFHAVG
ncbi:MAG TPA: signal peptidase I [Thermoanaerobaculia bacterium]|nr:signal peptidase I [Thermoanaerobaculia bacterium]HQN08141.1 signal peptidase I [Thermoanaerobaculia bacterium]